MSSSSTGGRRRSSTRSGSDRRRMRSQLSGRGVALPQSSTAPPGARGARRRRVRRSAGRSPACRRSRAPRRPRPGRGRCSGANTAERGPDADPRRAAAQALPLVVALAEPELRVQDRDALAEALLEAARRLRRERDLGHQHDRRAPLRERRLRRRAGRPRSCRCRSRRAAAAPHGGARAAARAPRPTRPLRGGEPMRRRDARRRPPPPRSTAAGRAPIARRPSAHQARGARGS